MLNCNYDVIDYKVYRYFVVASLNCIIIKVTQTDLLRYFYHAEHLTVIQMYDTRHVYNIRNGFIISILLNSRKNRRQRERQNKNKIKTKSLMREELLEDFRPMRVRFHSGGGHSIFSKLLLCQKLRTLDTKLVELSSNTSIFQHSSRTVAFQQSSRGDTLQHSSNGVVFQHSNRRIVFK